jgi:hypothetical protein
MAMHINANNNIITINELINFLNIVHTYSNSRENDMENIYQNINSLINSIIYRIDNYNGGNAGIIKRINYFYEIKEFMDDNNLSVIHRISNIQAAFLYHED